MWPLYQQSCTSAIEPGVLVSPHGVIQSLVEELPHHDLDLLLAVEIRRRLGQIVLPDDVPQVLLHEDQRIHQLAQRYALAETPSPVLAVGGLDLVLALL